MTTKNLRLKNLYRDHIQTDIASQVLAVVAFNFKMISLFLKKSLILANDQASIAGQSFYRQTGVEC